MAATTILLPLNIDSELIRISSILAIIITFIVLAALSVKFNLLVKYSRINIYMFLITTITLFTTITTLDSENIDTGKILPFQGMINDEPWKELLSNPYWWYFEATVVSWSIFCGRFVAYCSNGYSVKNIIRYGTISLIILTSIWHLVSAATGYTLSFSRGWMIYTLTAFTMLGFAVTSLDSASKTLLNDLIRIFTNRKLNLKPNLFLVVIMGIIGLINIIILYTGSSKLFTMIFCLVFIPYLVKAIVYSVKFAIGKVDYNKSGTITENEYIKICNKEPDEEDCRKNVE